MTHRAALLAFTAAGLLFATRAAAAGACVEVDADRDTSAGGRGAGREQETGRGECEERCTVSHLKFPPGEVWIRASP